MNNKFCTDFVSQFKFVLLMLYLIFSLITLLYIFVFDMMLVDRTMHL